MAGWCVIMVSHLSLLALFTASIERSSENNILFTFWWQLTIIPLLSWLPCSMAFLLISKCAYSSKIEYLNNNHLLLSDNTKEETNSLVEIDLLGKIYKQYKLNNPYLGDYKETDTSLIIKTDKLIELDKQTGYILNVEESSTEVFSKTNNNYQAIQPLYKDKSQYNIIKSTKHDLTKETKQSNKNILLVGYKNPDKIYNSYNIKINKTIDNLQIIGDFNENDEVYLILDKFLDKRIYDVNSKYTTINKKGLSGKYSIYIKINNTIYKTNNYIKF